jgi:hypothetical protein
LAVPYTDGDGGSYDAWQTAAFGVAGLTASLAAGSFASGAGGLTYTIAGIPDTAGMASFALSIGGQACTVAVPVTGCRAMLAPGQWRLFLCHNLAAANPAADPFSPSWEINGGYWQWEHMGPATPEWRTTNTPNFAHGPTGPAIGNANTEPISGWSLTPAPNIAWSDAAKTAEDTCPAGFRIPTRAQWEGLLTLNKQTTVGSWLDNAIDYGSGRYFGPDLLLPAADNRDNVNGSQFVRGNAGYYWSSSPSGDYNSWFRYFSSSNSYGYALSRMHGKSVRCVAE